MPLYGNSLTGLRSVRAADKLTTNFTGAEFRHGSGTSWLVHPMLIAGLQSLRTQMNQPLRIVRMIGPASAEVSSTTHAPLLLARKAVNMQFGVVAPASRSLVVSVQGQRVLAAPVGAYTDLVAHARTRGYRISTNGRDVLQGSSSATSGATGFFSSLLEPFRAIGDFFEQNPNPVGFGAKLADEFSDTEVGRVVDDAVRPVREVVQSGASLIGDTTETARDALKLVRPVLPLLLVLALAKTGIGIFQSLGMGARDRARFISGGRGRRY